MEAFLSILFYLSAVLYIIVGMVIISVLFVLTVLFDRNRVVLHIFSRYWSVGLCRINPLWRCRLEGGENVARDGVYVITVNHQSMLDIPLLYLLPHVVYKWVSKREVYKIPFFGAALWMHGDIAIERGALNAYEVMEREGKEFLKRGVSIMIFPEGTRSRDGEIHRYKQGAFMLAKSAGVGILPCVVDGTFGMLNGWKFKRSLMTVGVMPPLSAEHVAQTPLNELVSEVREMSVDKLNEIRKRRSE